MNPNTPQPTNMNPGMQVPMSPEQYAAWYNQQLQMMQQMQSWQQPSQQVGPMMPQAPMPNYNQMPVGMYPQSPQPGMQQMQQPQAQMNPVANQPMMVNGQLNPAVLDRDPNVLAFMNQAVKEKYKDQEVTQDFLKTESERLYDDFGSNLVSHFEPMLNEDQLKQFDQMLQDGATQDQLLQYLMSCIPDLMKKMEEVLLGYKENYLMSF